MILNAFRSSPHTLFRQKHKAEAYSSGSILKTLLTRPRFSRLPELERPAWSITTLLHLASAAVFVPSLLFVALLLFQNARTDRERLGVMAAAKANEIAAVLDEHFQGLLGAAQVLTTSQALPSADYQMLYDVAKKTTRLYSHNVSLGLHDGTQLFDTRIPFGHSVQKTVGKQLAIDRQVIDTGVPTVTPVHIGTSGRPEVDLVVPAQCGIDTCVLKFAVETAHLQTMALASLPDETCIIAVTDAEGVFAARTKNYDSSVATKAPPALVNMLTDREKGSGSIINKEGVEVDNTFQHLKNANLVATVSVPRTALIAPFWTNLRYLVILTAIWIFFTLIGSSLVARRIRSGLIDLAQASPSVAKGLPFLAPHTPVREVNELGRSLMAASVAIQEHQAAIAANAEHTRFLMREVLHRAKNQLTIIQGMVRQTISRADNTTEFESRFSERLRGLAETQNLLVQESWEGAPVGDLIRSHIQHYLEEFGDRIRLHGPRLVIAPEPAQNLGMVFHELASNSAKYGALSNLKGQIRVTWTVDGDKFLIEWAESGGPVVQEPKRKGFGTSVITRVAAQSLDGEVVLNYDPAGFEWKLSGGTSYFVQKGNHL